MTEFNKKVLFEMYKDKAVMGRNKFKVNVMRKHKLSESDARNLYDMILNYQIDKYGGQVNYFTSKIKDYDRNFMLYSSSQRRKRIDNVKMEKEEKRVLERIYENQ